VAAIIPVPRLGVERTASTGSVIGSVARAGALDVDGCHRTR
jgi:hypothetical protein